MPKNHVERDKDNRKKATKAHKDEASTKVVSYSARDAMPSKKPAKYNCTPRKGTGTCIVKHAAGTRDA